MKASFKVAVLVISLIFPASSTLSAQENVSPTGSEQTIALTPEEQSRKSVGTTPSQNAAFDFSRDDPIKIVYPVVMPPYTFENDTGEAQGLAVDLLRLWSKKTGILLQFTIAP